MDQKMSDKLCPKVLHVAAEMTPFIKQGGLGDVLGALPEALRSVGVDARVLVPAYPGVLERCDRLGISCTLLHHRIHIALNYRVFSASIYQSEVSGVPVYLLLQEELFTNAEIYPTHLNAESLLPFIFLSLACFELAHATDWQPEIVHAHDWSTSFVPIALRWHSHYKQFSKSFDSILTIYNLSHQGILEKNSLFGLGIPEKSITQQTLEFYGQCNLLKGGIVAADAVTTLSPHYSWEIQTTDGGFGLHSILTENKHKLYGILNGIDYKKWDPENDPFCTCSYNKKNVLGKRRCKEKLLQICGWSDDGKPLVAFVGRLIEQKGIDILLSSLDWILVGNCKMVFLGTGQEHYKKLVTTFAEKYPDHFWACTNFDESLAHQIYAGSDILLMPSLFEPCGMSQMIAMRYGTVPVVRATGGLADTVIDFDSSPDGTGFLFSEYSATELADAVFRAVDAFNNKEAWGKIIQNCMQADFCWSVPATAYKNLYSALQEGGLLEK